VAGATLLGDFGDGSSRREKNMIVIHEAKDVPV
jgi:hypothetical protein